MHYTDSAVQLHIGKNSSDSAMIIDAMDILLQRKGGRLLHSFQAIAILHVWHPLREAE